VRVSTLLSLNSTLELSLPTKPPISKKPINQSWSDVSNLIDTTLRKLPKASTPHQVYQQKFIEFKSKYPTSIFFYTYGSKISSAISFSVVSNDISQQHLLPYYSSIFSAEIISIYNAVLLVTCSDSLSAINAIANPSPQPQLDNFC